MTAVVDLDSAALETTEPDTLAYRLYQQLRRDICSGALPPGKPLRTAWLNTHYQASTSPVREALARLAGEGFVTAEGKKGFRVRGLSRADYIDTYRLRHLLEAEGLRLSIEGGGVEWEGRVLAAMHRLTNTTVRDVEDKDSLAARGEAHRVFHAELISGCGSPWLLLYHEQLVSHLDRYRIIVSPNVLFDAAYLATVDGEHATLTEYALGGKTEEALALLRTHRDRSYDQIEGAMRASAGRED